MRAGLTRKQPDKVRVTQSAQPVEAPCAPKPKPNWFQRLLDAISSRSLVEDLEMENCRLMLQVQEVQHRLELLHGRHMRLEANSEELREQLEQTLEENLVLRTQKPVSAKKNSRRR